MNRKKLLKFMFLSIRKGFRFKNTPVFIKLFLSFILVFISMIFLSYITFTYYKNDKEESTWSVIHQMNKQTVSKINEYMMDLNSITKLPLFSENSDYNFLKELEQFNETNNHNLVFQKLTEQMSYKILNYKTTIQSVFLFNLKGKSEYRMIGSNLSKEFNPKDEDWFKQSIDSFGKPVVISTFPLPYVADMHEKPVYVFSMARGLVSVEKSEVVGIILINCKIDFLANLCKEMLIVPNQRIAVIDRDGNIVYDTIQKNITQKLEDNLLNLVITGSNENQNVRIRKNDLMISYKTSDITGWKIVNIIPVNELNKKINNMRNTTAFITLVMILIASFFVVVISRQIVVPIKRLVLLMKLVEKGDFDVKIKFNNRDEIGQLAKTFNRMTVRVKKLINEVYVDKIKQKELELQMLQNQINPHFLYNTLESIHMMAEINRDHETSRMARALGRILRYGINRDKDKVTVKEELDHLQDYIMLQRNRFEDIFDIIVNVEESLYNHIIIKLILQPLVENAIYHGLSDRAGGGKIEIRGYNQAEKLIFEVIDNGKGMDEIMVNRMNDYINDMDNSFKSIGLKNVNKRIKLHYGNDYGIEVFSKPGAGTMVKVTVPCIMG